MRTQRPRNCETCTVSLYIPNGNSLNLCIIRDFIVSPLNLTLVGEFAVANNVDKSDRSTLSRDDFEKNRRSSTQLNGKYIEGELCSFHMDLPNSDNQIRTFCFEFNRKKFGWSYDWASNKHLTAVEHVFLVSAYLTPQPEWESAKLLVVPNHHY